MEAMLAAFIFTFGALGLVKLVYGSAGYLSTASQITQAATLAADKLDYLTALEWDDPDLVGSGPGTTHTEATNIGPSGTAFAVGGDAISGFGTSEVWFARSWVVTDLAMNVNVATPTLKQIKVLVEWTDRATKRTRSISVIGARAAE